MAKSKLACRIIVLSWREDVMAFTETCRRVDISNAIERSRSGNGAHVWFFFSRLIPAAMATSQSFITGVVERNPRTIR